MIFLYLPMRAPLDLICAPGVKFLRPGLRLR
jgi:hypothetical protein